MVAVLEINKKVNINKNLINWWVRLSTIDRILNALLSIVLIVFWSNDLALVAVLMTVCILSLSKMVSRKKEWIKY